MKPQQLFQDLQLPLTFVFLSATARSQNVFRSYTDEMDLQRRQLILRQNLLNGLKNG